MSGMRRYYEPGVIYNITCNTYSRRLIFKDKRACSFLMNMLGYYKFVLNFSLYCFCIMPDHIHLIIQPHRARYNISEVMRYIKGDFGRNYNKLIRKNGIVWQRRFFDTGLRTEDELLTRINYILQNPVKANIIKTAEDYPFSSAKAYLTDIDDHITDKYTSK